MCAVHEANSRPCTTNTEVTATWGQRLPDCAALGDVLFMPAPVDQLLAEVDVM